jgi:hypothetical protein
MNVEEAHLAVDLEDEEEVPVVVLVVVVEIVVAEEVEEEALEEEVGVEEVHNLEVVVVQEADHPVEWEAEVWVFQEVEVDHREAEVVIHSMADRLVQVGMALQVSMDLANTNSSPGKRKHVEALFCE